MLKIYLIFILSLILIGCSSMPVYRNLNNEEMFKKQFYEVKYKLFYPTKESIVAEYGDKTYFLCCNNCKEIFKQNISKFVKEDNIDNKDYHKGGTGRCH